MSLLMVPLQMKLDGTKYFDVMELKLDFHFTATLDVNLTRYFSSLRTAN